MTEISRRARFCPQCHQPISFFAAVKGFIKTGGWFVTSCVAAWYGLEEHAEKLGAKQEVVAIKESLKDQSRNLLAANSMQQALTNKLTQLASYSGYGQAPYAASSVRAPVGFESVEAGVEGERSFSVPLAAEATAVDTSAELARLQSELDDALAQEPVNERLVERLAEQIVAAQFGP